MSKKLINQASSVVDDALKGLTAVNPALRQLEGHRVVVRSDIELVKNKGKVTILSGGGRGLSKNSCLPENFYPRIKLFSKNIKKY